MAKSVKDEPFYRPLWRRIAIVAVTGIWALLEIIYAGEMLWMALSVGIFAYSAWTFIITYPKPPQ